MIIIVIAVILGFVVYRFFVKNNEPEFILEEAALGAVIKEVSETGAVKISEETNLNFKNAGRIEEIYVKIGDQIEQGQSLAKLGTGQLYIELSEAEAALEVTQADYNKLLAGSSEQEIKIAETEVLSAEINLNNAKQNLEDVKADAQEDIIQAYQDALDDLEDSYLKIYNAHKTADDIKQSYFTSSDQEGVKVQENLEKIKQARDAAKFYLDSAKESSAEQDIDLALLELKKNLSDSRESLEIIRDMTDKPSYRDSVSDSDKTSLDNQKSYINTAYANIISASQTISGVKITNQTNINDAQANIFSAEIKLLKAQDELALKKAGPTQENIDLYLAKIKQAQSKVFLLQDKIRETVLKSPGQGQITKINKRKGEMVQATDSIVSFLPSGPFQVEVDIYEEDVVEVNIDNIVKIILPAFPDDVFEGRVASIDPAEKLINGVVYYEVVVNFQDSKEGIKPGMTADIIIETAKKENVLIISKSALKKENGNKIIRVFEEGEVEEKKIEVGLEGDEYVEVISGLQEGEQVIVGEKK